MVETFSLAFPATDRVARRAHVGVVASGNCEVLLEPGTAAEARVTIRTSVNGFEGMWRAVLARFFERHPVAVSVEIDDFGATPAVVSLRLEQAIEAAQ